MHAPSSRSSFVSEKKLAANGANARHSTGPRTTAGKQRASRNALHHGLFASDVLFPHEKADLYHAMRSALLCEMEPRGLLEGAAAEAVVTAHWQLRRLRTAIANAFEQRAQAIGRDMLQIMSDQKLVDKLEAAGGAAALAAMREWIDEANEASQTLPLPIAEPDQVLAADLSGRDPLCWTIADEDGNNTPPKRSSASGLQRLLQYEQKLQNTILRHQRELHRLQDRRKKRREDPDEAATELMTELLDEALDEEERENEENEANEENEEQSSEAERLTPSARPGQRAGERGTNDATLAKAIDSASESADPSPHPSPRGGEREGGARNRGNEPTEGVARNCENEPTEGGVGDAPGGDAAPNA